MTDLTISDVLDVEYPGAPEWSADGRYLGALVHEDDGKSLLVADTDRDAAADEWRVSPGEGHVADFEWAPDPRPSAFVVTTDEGETCLGRADDRTLELVASSPAGESHHRWNAAGDRLAYYRDGRLCLRNAETLAERILEVPGWDAFLPSERMLAWNDDGRLAFTFTDRGARQVGAVAPETGDLRWRTDTPASSYNPAWLADGRLAFERIEDSGTVRCIVAADTASGERTELVREEDDRGVVSAGAPAVSPDGTRLAVALPLDGWEHIYVLETDGNVRQLTSGAFEDKGLAGSSPRWIDEQTLVFASNRRDPGHRHLFSAEADSGVVAPLVTSQGTNVSPAPSPSGNRVAYVHADRERSPEIRVQTLDAAADDEAAGSRARVTRSAVESWPVEPLAPRAVAFESDDGREIRGYLLDPRETDAVADDAADLPSVVWVHGGPMRQMRDGWHPSRSYGLAYAFHQYLAREGYVGLLVNYRGGIGYGREFRQSLTDGYGRDEMADVAAGAQFLREREYTDEAVGIWGLSYGGYAALQLLGTRPEAFDAGVNLAGLADLRLYEEWGRETKFPAVESAQSVVFGGNPWEAADEWDAASPKTHFENYEAPLYNFHGTDDAYVNFEQLDVVIEGMLEHGNEYEAEYFPGENHVFSGRRTWRRTLEKIDRAFDEHLT